MFVINNALSIILIILIVGAIILGLIILIKKEKPNINNNYDNLQELKKELKQVRNQLDESKTANQKLAERLAGYRATEPYNEKNKKDLDKSEKDLDEFKNINQKLNDAILVKNSEISKLEEKYEVLNREKSGLNIKQIGEELENWIQHEYNKNSFSFNNSSFKKTDKSILGAKPDFQFLIRDENNNQICNLIIEAKTQSNYTANSPKLKNSNHLDKLASDARNFRADYSVLVSELEMQKDDFLIKKVNDKGYQNMFIIRPHYFISFLNLMCFFALKKNKIEKANINLKDKQTILTEFNIFKDGIFKDFNNNIKNGTQKIFNASRDIKKKADLIEREAATILKDILIKLETKIRRYSIERKIPALKKIVK